MILEFVSSRSSAYVPLRKCPIWIGLGFRDVHLLGEYLREPVDEKRLSGSLPVNTLNDFRRAKDLADFARILSQGVLADLLRV